MRREWVVEWYHPETDAWIEERPFDNWRFAASYYIFADALAFARAATTRYGVRYRVRNDKRTQFVMVS